MSERLPLHELAYQKSFTDLMDAILEDAQDDESLSRAMDRIRAKGEERGITFYEQAYLILVEFRAKEKAKAWIKERTK